MNARDHLSPEEVKKLCAAYEILEQFSHHHVPVIRFNCRKAKTELWQALFDLDLPIPESPDIGEAV